MRRLLVLVMLTGCGRIGFDATGNIDLTGDGALPTGRWKSVTVGPAGTCGITVDDALICWGNGGYGVLGTGTDTIAQAPTEVGTGWSQVQIGRFHSCGVKKDSSLWCWGYNQAGGLGTGQISAVVKSPVQVASTGWASVTVGEGFSCGIKTAGELACWGFNESGQVGDDSGVDQPRPVIIGSGWTTVSAGRMHACAIKSDGSLWCWGWGKEGQLGNDSLDKQFVPQAVAPGRTWTAVSASEVHTCAIEASTTDVWCWGENYSTMLGDGTYTPSAVPKKTPMKGIAIATGNATTCVLHPDGTASCVGSASRADFGAAGDADVKVWTKIALSGLTAIAAGGQTTCALDGEKHVFCVGANSYGQTGQPHGEVHDASAPTDARRDWVAITASRRHACARVTDGSTWCWGDGYAGQNGDGFAHDRQVPRLAGAGFVRLALGEQTTLGLKADSTLWAWGVGVDGSGSLAPRQVDTNVAAMAMGDLHGCGISGTTLRCAGENEAGQLGDGTNMSSTTEIAIAGQWKDVWAGWEMTCATDAADTLSCWGRGSAGQLGNGTTVDKNTPVSTGLTLVTHVGFGFATTCALRSNGEVYCFGDGESGQLGNGSPSASTTPVRVGTRSDWTHLAVGDAHVCGIAAGGLYCWGHGDEGQLGDPALVDRNTPRQVDGATDWVDVAAGDHFTCAVKANGARYCFGANEDGQLGNDRTWQKTFLAVP